MKKYVSFLLSVLMVLSTGLSLAACGNNPPAQTTDGTSVIIDTSEPVFPDDYNVISIEEYRDKTLCGFLSQMVGFLSGYEFVANSAGTARVAMPDSCFEMCNGR